MVPPAVVAAAAALQRSRDSLPRVAVPADVAEWLAGLSLAQYGAGLVGALGVAELNDVADLFDVDLQKIAMPPEDRALLLRKARKLRAHAARAAQDAAQEESAGVEL
jgi:hypothetical protein